MILLYSHVTISDTFSYKNPFNGIISRPQLHQCPHNFLVIFRNMLSVNLEDIVYLEPLNTISKLYTEITQADASMDENTSTELKGPILTWVICILSHP